MPTQEYKIGTGNSLTLATDQRHVISIGGRIAVTFIEFPDILFNLNSAVPCLDKDENLLHGLSHAYFHAKDHSDEELVLLGHTDTSGAPKVNYPLSDLRAAGVMALLTGDEDAWSSVVKKKSKVEDYQRTFKSLADLYYWDCDPGAVDNQDGPNTRASVKGFQREANSIFDLGLVVDGIIGPKTWLAIFNVYRLLLERVGVDLEHVYPLGNNGKGVYGCGESFPIEEIENKNLISQANRRVEIYFSARGHIKPLLPPPNPNTNLTPAECILYNKRACKVTTFGSLSSLSFRYDSIEGDRLAGVTAHLFDELGGEVGESQVTDDRGFVFWVNLKEGEYEVSFEGA